MNVYTEVYDHDPYSITVSIFITMVLSLLPCNGEPSGLKWCVN